MAIKKDDLSVQPKNIDKAPEVNSSIPPAKKLSDFKKEQVLKQQTNPVLASNSLSTAVNLSQATPVPVPIVVGK